VLKTQPSSINHDEFLVDCYAGYLLMPRAVVINEFHRRNLNYKSYDPLHYYIVACAIGVGYSTLVHHMRSALGLINWQSGTGLLRTTPKEIKSRLTGQETTNELIVVDSHWSASTVDLQVGDMIYTETLPHFHNDNLVIRRLYGDAVLVEAVKPGITQLENLSPNQSIYVRISRQQFSGWSKYRHLEEELEQSHTYQRECQ
jgi:hypothetical protein